MHCIENKAEMKAYSLQIPQLTISEKIQEVIYILNTNKSMQCPAVSAQR